MLFLAFADVLQENLEQDQEHLEKWQQCKTAPRTRYKKSYFEKLKKFCYNLFVNKQDITKQS